MRVVRCLPVLVVIICLSASSLYGQHSYRLSGWVRDSVSGKPLSGAHIYIEQTSQGASTTDNGSFSLLLDTGTYTLRSSYIGYQTRTITLRMRPHNQQLNILLCPKDFEGKTITVTDRRIRQHVEESQMGKTELYMEEVRKMPAFSERTMC